MRLRTHPLRAYHLRHGTVSLDTISSSDLDRLQRMHGPARLFAQTAGARIAETTSPNCYRRATLKTAVTGGTRAYRLPVHGKGAEPGAQGMKRHGVGRSCANIAAATDNP